MRRQVKRWIVSAVAFSMLVPAVSAPKAEAAKKPSLPKSASVTVGKKKKITVKGVKAKKIKKTTWAIPKKGKKIVALSKKKKNSVTIKGKKAGKSTTLTAKIKVGKKTYKKKCKIKVKAAKKPVVSTPVVKGSSVTPTPANSGNGTAPTPTATATPTATPTLRPLNKEYTKVEEPAAQDTDVFPSTPPKAAIDEATKVGYHVDYEDVAIGTKTNDAIEGEGIQGAVLRGNEKDADGGAGTSNDYLEVVDGESLPIEGNNTHVLRCYRQVKTWQGPMFNMTSYLDDGCTYELTAKVMSPDNDLMCSYQIQDAEELDPGYGNYGPNNSITKYSKGKWNDVSITITVPDDMHYFAVYFESFNGVGNDDIYIDDISLTKTVQVAPDKTIPSLYDTYKDVFKIVGVGAGISSIVGSKGSEFIADQYNAYTPGNEFKPDAILGATPGKLVKVEDEVREETDFYNLEEAKKAGYYIPEDYASYEDNKVKGEIAMPRLNFQKVDAIMKACHDKGVKLRGHTLLWHQQTSVLFFQKGYVATKNVGTKNYSVSKECMNSRLEFFVKTVMSHILSSEYADVLYGYDVVNEYLHSTNETKGKPTYWDEIYGTKVEKTADNSTGVTLRPEFVKAAFTYAHEMLVKYNRTDVKLFYNDYNCYDVKEELVHLVDYINEDGQVCDGVGLQSHLDITNQYPTPKRYAELLECLRLNLDPKLEIQVTELDAGVNYNVETPLTDEQQAVYYDQIMNALLTSKKKGNNITGLILWSLYDGVSWRDANRPCLFSGLYMPKSAFYGVIGAKTRYWD